MDNDYIAPLRIHGVLLPGGVGLQASIDKLRSYSAVMSVEPDRDARCRRRRRTTRTTATSGRCPRSAGTTSTASVSPGGSATVAILDTGVDGSHPDLDGNVVPGTSILDGSNGLTDPNGHGTAMAGIVAAETNNGAGIAGVGYSGVRVMPVTVLGADGTGQDSDIIEGVVYAADHDADVILMAFSNPGYSELLQAAIDYAWENGVVLVAATGNDGSSAPNFPAGDRGVIGVSNTDQSRRAERLEQLRPGRRSSARPGPASDDVGRRRLRVDHGDVGVGRGGRRRGRAHQGELGRVERRRSSSRLARNAEAVGTREQTGNGRLNLDRAIADTSTDSIQPAGAAPVGGGGPFVGPYVAAAPSIETYLESTFATVRETFERGDTVFARATGGLNNGRFYRYQFFDKTGALKGPLSACFQGSASPTPGYSYTTLSTDLLSDSCKSVRQGLPSSTPPELQQLQLDDKPAGADGLRHRAVRGGPGVRVHEFGQSALRESARLPGQCHDSYTRLNGLHSGARLQAGQQQYEHHVVQAEQRDCLSEHERQ